jgi:hypothetical protein
MTNTIDYFSEDEVTEVKVLKKIMSVPKQIISLRWNDFFQATVLSKGYYSPKLVKI